MHPLLSQMQEDVFFSASEYNFFIARRRNLAGWQQQGRLRPPCDVIHCFILGERPSLLDKSRPSICTGTVSRENWPPFFYIHERETVSRDFGFSQQKASPCLVGGFLERLFAIFHEVIQLWNRLPCVGYTGESIRNGQIRKLFKIL